MDYYTESAEKVTPRVQFGARDDDSMPLSWAEKGLTWLKQTHPGVWMDMMGHVWGIEKTARRGRKAGES